MAAHPQRLEKRLTCTEVSLSEMAVILHVTDFSHHHNGCLTDRKEDSLGLSVLKGQVYCGETWWSSAGHKHGKARKQRNLAVFLPFLPSMSAAHEIMSPHQLMG